MCTYYIIVIVRRSKKESSFQVFKLQWRLFPLSCATKGTEKSTPVDSIFIFFNFWAIEWNPAAAAAHVQLVFSFIFFWEELALRSSWL